MRLLISTLTLIMVLLISSGMASEFIANEGNVVASDETIDDDLYLFSNNCEIYGEITGDLSAFCYDIESEGTIGGSCNIFAFNLILGGIVNNSARIFGFDIDIIGDIRGNVLAFGQEIHIDRDAIIEKDLNAWGEVVFVDGIVKGDVEISGGSVVITGRIEGNLYIEAEEISIVSPAVVGGDFNYISAEKAYIEDGARIDGEIDWEEVEVRKTLDEAISDISHGIRIILFLMSLVTGLGLILIFRNHTRESSNQIQNKFWQSFGIGFLAFVIFMSGSILLMILILGIPLGIMMMILGMILFYIGKIYVAIVIGRLLFKMLAPKSKIAIGWEFIIGLIVLSLVFLIPVLGAIMYFVTFLVGAGGAIAAEIAINRKFGEVLTPASLPPTSEITE